MLELYGINVKELTEDQLLEKISNTRNQIAKYSNINYNVSQLQMFLETYMNEYSERLILKNHEFIQKNISNKIDSESYGKEKTLDNQTITKATKVRKFGGELTRKDRE
jgi:hypothetical protein